MHVVIVCRMDKRKSWVEEHREECPTQEDARSVFKRFVELSFQDSEPIRISIHNHEGLAGIFQLIPA